MATVELTAQNFNDTIKSNDVVMIDFWASWCGPCKMFAPIYEKASTEHDNIVFAKVDTEAQPDIAGAFEIRAIPTLMVFREQIAVFSQAGALRPAQLEQLIEQIMGLDMDDVRKQIEAHDHEHADGDEA